MEDDQLVEHNGTQNIPKPPQGFFSPAGQQRKHLFPVGVKRNKVQHSPLA